MGTQHSTLQLKEACFPKTVPFCGNVEYVEFVRKPVSKHVLLSGEMLNMLNMLNVFGTYLKNSFWVDVNKRVVFVKMAFYKNRQTLFVFEGKKTRISLTLSVLGNKGALLSVIHKSCALLKTLFYSVFNETQLCRKKV